MARKLHPALQILLNLVLTLALILVLELIFAWIKGGPVTIDWGIDLGIAAVTALLASLLPRMGLRGKK